MNSNQTIWYQNMNVVSEQRHWMTKLKDFVFEL